MKKQYGTTLYLQQAVIVEHVSAQKQVEGPVEQWEVASGTFFLGIHNAIFVPHFLDVFSDALSALCGLLHFLLQLLDVLIVLLKRAADSLLRNQRKRRIVFSTKHFATHNFC